MKHFIFVLTLLMAPSTILIESTFATEDWKDPNSEYQKGQKGWAEFSSQFEAAFKHGDTEELERLKEEGGPKVALGNINDLGGQFHKYGPGMKKWDQLIEDAKRNKE